MQNTTRTDAPNTGTFREAGAVCVLVVGQDQFRQRATADATIARRACGCRSRSNVSRGPIPAEWIVVTSALDEIVVAD